MFMQAPQYQAWCTGEPFNTNSSSYNNIDNTPFFSNPKCIQLYKAHVKTVLTRCVCLQLLLLLLLPPSSVGRTSCKRCMLLSMLLSRC
jgi:hypothetical protein